MKWTREFDDWTESSPRITRPGLDVVEHDGRVAVVEQASGAQLRVDADAVVPVER